VVEGARLESVCASDGTAGSNPVLSAKINNVHLGVIYFARIPGSEPALLQSKSPRFGAVNEAKESAQHFLEQVSGGGFSRYPVLL
jgi:hypothetical protein